MLLLFDIDGTLLVGAAQAHRDALHAALREVHGIEIPTGEVATAGRTDRAIVRSILVLAGVDDAGTDARMDDTLAAAVAAYETGCPPDLTDKVNPGIPGALTTLTAVGHELGLVTGNLEAIATRKLGAAGLGDWFVGVPGGYGSDGEHRGALPTFARARAGRDGQAFPREQTLIIGDTPQDIACARTGGVRCVAIATGPFAADELRDADVVVEHARELPAAIATLAD